MKKYKIAMIASNLELNGIGIVVLNYIKNLDLKKFELTIFAGESVSELHVKECAERNIKLVKLPHKKKSSIKYYLKLFKLISREYDILHIHGNSTTMTMELLIGLLKGIKIRVAHCHTVQNSNTLFKKILTPFFNRLCTGKIACSSAAGKWIFKDKFLVLKNGVDFQKYSFNEIYRKNIRKKYDISEDCLVIGHIGRLNLIKNQEFLFSVHEKLCDIDNSIILFLVGDGPYYDYYKSIISDLKYKDNIILCGETYTPEKFYNAMDVFAFPSKYEGLGLAVIEAQLSGLPCVISKNVPDEVVISDRTVFKGIEQSDIYEWISSIQEFAGLSRDEVKFNDNKINFDSKEIVKQLEDYYFKILGKE